VPNWSKVIHKVVGESGNQLPIPSILMHEASSASAAQGCQARAEIADRPEASGYELSAKADSIATERRRARRKYGFAAE
jgi:hypothetical protein